VGTTGSFSGGGEGRVALGQLGHEVEHSLPSNAEGNNECSYNATSPCGFRL